MSARQNAREEESELAKSARDALSKPTIIYSAPVIIPSPQPLETVDPLLKKGKGLRFTPTEISYSAPLKPLPLPITSSTNSPASPSSTKKKAKGGHRLGNEAKRVEKGILRKKIQMIMRKEKNTEKLESKWESKTACVESVTVAGESIVPTLKITPNQYMGQHVGTAVAAMHDKLHKNWLHSATLGEKELYRNKSRNQKVIFRSINESNRLNRFVGKHFPIIWSNPGESTNLKSGNKIIGHRSAATERSKIILQLVTGLLELLNEKTEDDSNGGTGSRGAHTSKTFGLNCGMGGTGVHLPEFHKENREEVEKVTLSAPFIELCGLLKVIIKRIWPLLAERMARTDLDPSLSGIFGLSNLACFNVASKEAGKVHCRPHTDYRNSLSSMCIVIPLGTFDSKKTSFLVLWELGVAMEIPFGSFMIFPSAAITHWNVDLCELEFEGSIEEGGDGPSLENVLSDRCSLVFYTQAMVQILAEKGMALRWLDKLSKRNEGFENLWIDGSTKGIFGILIALFCNSFSNFKEIVEK